MLLQTPAHSEPADVLETSVGKDRSVSEYEERRGRKLGLLGEHFKGAGI
jgi:hypothetical protein